MYLIYNLLFFIFSPQSSIFSFVCFLLPFCALAKREKFKEYNNSDFCKNYTHFSTSYSSILTTYGILYIELGVSFENVCCQNKQMSKQKVCSPRNKVEPQLKQVILAVEFLLLSAAKL